MHNETPGYIKRSGIFTGALVLPFFSALIANGLDKLLFDQNLYGSWLWHWPIIGFWVLWLPGTALTVALLSYGVYTFTPERKNRTNWLRRALDVPHAWPVILPGIVAFGILFILAFHDSVHCWIQNPIHFVTRYHQTLQCTERGYLGG